MTYFLTQITRTTDAFASGRSTGHIHAIGLEKVAHRFGGHQHRLRRRYAIGEPGYLNRLQQRDAGEPAVAILRGCAGKAERRGGRQCDIAAAAKLGDRSLDAGHRGAAALVLRIGNAGEVERRLGGDVGEIERFQPARAINAQQREIVLLVLGDAIGVAKTRNRDREAAVGDLAVGNDRAVVTDDEAGAVFHRLARRRPGHLRRRRKRIERARHRDHDRFHGILGRLIVEDGKDADLVALEGAAQIKFLQALQAGQHEEVRLDHGVVDAAPGLLLLALGELCRDGAGFLAPRQLNLDRAGRRRPFGAVGVAGLLRHQFGRDAQPHAGAGIGDDLPADAFLLFLGGVRQGCRAPAD